MQPARDIMEINKPFEIKEKLYMKATVFYFSVSGTTKRFAEIIAEAMSAEGVEARAMSIEAVDEQWVKESRCVILGTPTYFADMAGTVKCFLEKCGSYEMSGKLAGAFATARYVHGGGEAAIQMIQTHFMCYGMLVYSGGSQGGLTIYLGPVAIREQADDYVETFRIYGSRMAKKALELWG